ncbi:MAG: bifunctional phosphopantothenoylcysteine decarboxylase/phosphopantothenate--cysteine ligase CoaBC [Sulfurospirillaceae bacterium]|nr:bifunctional phosphopantothenoylcysteine decarboxylase/phosphopantothenate--cysteine ligase CoaBC [Sulfurospirillaceae bacterium]
MKDLLQNRKILVGVTGSIAIYKTLELIRLFIKAGATVRVIMSEESKKFVTPLMFEAISQNEVMHVDTESWANDNNHIHIGKWADIFVVAPISANTINKIAHGIADNLLVQTLLAFNKNIFIAPSANTNMILHPSTQESLKKLENFGYKIIEPQDKLLACNDKGLGAMAEPDEIYWRICANLLQDQFWHDKDIIITGGGTKEKIDSVRYISNFSSGKMAKSLALCAYLLGAKVTYITTEETNELPNNIKVIIAPNSSTLESTLKGNIKPGSYLFMVAAISDYVCKEIYEGKLKKEDLGDEFSLALVKNIDILKSLNKKDIKTIGFKAELDPKTALENARNMLTNKGLDAVCLNVLDKNNNFGSDNNEVTLITAKEEKKIEFDTKLNVAFEILNELKNI